MLLRTKYKGTAKIAIKMLLGVATMWIESIFLSEAMIPNAKKQAPAMGKKKNSIQANSGQLPEWLPCAIQIKTGNISSSPPRVRWNDL